MPELITEPVRVTLVLDLDDTLTFQVGAESQTNNSLFDFIASLHLREDVELTVRVLTCNQDGAFVDQVCSDLQYAINAAYQSANASACCCCFSLFGSPKKMKGDFCVQFKQLNHTSKSKALLQQLDTKPQLVLVIDDDFSYHYDLTDEGHQQYNSQEKKWERYNSQEKKWERSVATEGHNAADIRFQFQYTAKSAIRSGYLYFQQKSVPVMTVESSCCRPILSRQAQEKKPLVEVNEVEKVLRWYSDIMESGYCWQKPGTVYQWVNQQLSSLSKPTSAAPLLGSLH